MFRSFSTQLRQKTITDGKMAASYKAFPLVEVKDCTIWVRGTCALQRHSAYTTRLDINLRHRNPRLAVPAMEIAKKEGLGDDGTSVLGMSANGNAPSALRV
jgi:hypothetical protein